MTTRLITRLIIRVTTHSLTKHSNMTRAIQADGSRSHTVVGKSTKRKSSLDINTRNQPRRHTKSLFVMRRLTKKSRKKKQTSDKGGSSKQASNMKRTTTKIKETSKLIRIINSIRTSMPDKAEII